MAPGVEGKDKFRNVMRYQSVYVFSFQVAVHDYSVLACFFFC